MIFEFPITNKELLLSCIPQRDPIVLVDALVTYSERAVTSGLQVSAQNLFIQGNLLTEPALIEHMAQTVALHTGFGYFLKKDEAPTGYIGSIAQLVINRLPKIDENLQTTATILHEFSGVTLVDLVVTIKEEIIATGQMKTVIAK